MVLNDYISKGEYWFLEMRRIIKVLLLSIVLGLVRLAASSTREPWECGTAFLSGMRLQTQSLVCPIHSTDAAFTTTQRWLF